MVDTVVDFISLIKDIRGNQFDSTGLPLNGKWKDIKDWHTSVGLIADQVILDAADVSSDKDAVAADRATVVQAILDVAAIAAQVDTSVAESAASAASALASELLAQGYVAEATAILNTVNIDVAALEAARIAAQDSATLSGTYSQTAQSAASDASADALAASIDAANASQAAANADVSENNALSYRDATETFYNSATAAATTVSGDASTSATYAQEAANSRDMSRLWATEAEDVLVNDGVHTPANSAFHWAQKAASITGGVTGILDLIDTPADFVGDAGAILRVNAGESGIEFIVGDPTAVGLGNVNNTSDVDKPLSTASTNALAAKASSTALSDLDLRVATVEADTVGITNELPAGNAPARVQISKVVYSVATQTLGAVEAPALTRYDLVASMIAAETIGAY